MKYQFPQGRNEIWEAGLADVLAFLHKNGIHPPKIYPEPPPVAANKWQTYGLYFGPSSYGGPEARDGRIWVNIDKARMPSYKQSRSGYSFPGHKTDRTPAGVLAHEIGHHVGRVCRFDSSMSWFSVWVMTKPVTSYEPTEEEAFAETMRIFILNPGLLSRGAPRRFYYLIDRGLKPLFDLDYDPLEFAPKHVKKSAAYFCNGA
jgi:hypothetical protein